MRIIVGVVELQRLHQRFKVRFMDAFETSATVQSAGEIRVFGVPFAPGTEVEVIISPKRQDAADFAREWESICRELRKQPATQSITDADIQREIEDYRAGR
jgi:hypothetical protein